MREQTLRQLWQKILKRSQKEGETLREGREKCIEDFLPELLQARYAADEVPPSEEALEASLARFLEAAREGRVPPSETTPAPTDLLEQPLEEEPAPSPDGRHSIWGRLIPLRKRETQEPGKLPLPIPAWKPLIWAAAGVLLLAGAVLFWRFGPREEQPKPEEAIVEVPDLAIPPTPHSLTPEDARQEPGPQEEPKGPPEAGEPRPQVPSPGAVGGGERKLPKIEKRKPKPVPPPATSPPRRKLRLAQVVGRGLERTAPGETDPGPVRAGAPLFAHDLLRTSAGVIGEVSLADGSRVTLNENTTLRLRPEGLVLYDGTLRIQTEPKRTRLRVHTPTGVRIEVVGTVFQVHFSKPTTQTTVTVEQGTVQVRRGGATVLVGVSEQCVVGPAGPPLPPLSISTQDIPTWAIGATEQGTSEPALTLPDFEITANSPSNVFPLTAQPCIFTLRQHVRRDVERPWVIRYQVVDGDSTILQKGQETGVAPAGTEWEQTFSIRVERSGLFLLQVTLQDGETTWERSLGFAVEGGGPGSP